MGNGYTTKHRHPSRFGEISRKAKHVGRIIAFLSREQLDFIDKIGKDALFTTGKKLSRTEIIRAIVEAVRALEVTGKDIHTPDELEERIKDVAKRIQQSLGDELKKGKHDHEDH